MSANKIQRHFDTHRVAQLEKGSQTTVYADSEVVIKDFRAMWLYLLFGLLQNPRNPKKAVTNRFREPYRRGKQTLGRYAVPYEVVESVRIEVLSGLSEMGAYTSTRPRTFRNVVVQQRVPEKNILTSYLDTLIAGGDIQGIGDLFEHIPDFFWALIDIGAYPSDPIPENHAVEDGKLKLVDMGSLVFSGDHLQRLLRLAMRQKRAYNTVAYTGLLAGLDHPEISKISWGFSERMAELFDGEQVLRRFGKRMSNRKKVPDLSL